MPRPEAKIDLTEMEKLCGMQCTDEEIAAFFAVSARTIERRRKKRKFREVMDRARAKGRVSVRRNLFRLSSGGNIAATIFLSKNLLGYKDFVSNEHSGPNGGPIELALVEALQKRRNSLAEKKKLNETVSDASASPPN